MNLVPFHVVAILLFACRKCLSASHRITFYIAVMACASLGHLFSLLVQPTFEVAAVLNCLMLGSIVSVRVVLQLYQFFTPAKCRSRIRLQIGKKRSPEKATKGKRELASRSDHASRIASVSSTLLKFPRKRPDATSTTCTPESNPQMASSVATSSMLKDYYGSRAAAVPRPVSLHTQYGMTSGIRRASALSPIASDESSLSDTSF